MGNALVLDGVSKIYEVGGVELVALHEVDLAVAEEEVVTLLGPSGSGKTTLLSIAGGLLSATTGRVVVGGKDITRARARKLTAFRRKRVGFIFQAVNLVPFLTARENLMVVAELARRDRGAAGHRADRLLEELGLGHRMNNLPSQLSGGERQRVAIGRALMNQPALVLVDEPTSALDSDLGIQVMELIVSEVKARGAAAVIVTHDGRMVRYGDRVLTMADGRIAGMAPRPEFMLNRGPAPPAELEAAQGLRALPAAAESGGYGHDAPGYGPGTGQFPAARPGAGFGPGTGQVPAARSGAGFGPGTEPGAAGPGHGVGFGPGPAAEEPPAAHAPFPISMQQPAVLPAPDRVWRRPITPPGNRPGAGRRPPPLRPIEPEGWPEPAATPPPRYEPQPRFEPEPEPAPEVPPAAWGSPEFFAAPPPSPGYPQATPLPAVTPPPLPPSGPEWGGPAEPAEPDESDRDRWLQQLTPPPTKAQPRPVSKPDRPIWPTRYWAPPSSAGAPGNGHHPDQGDPAEQEGSEGYEGYDYGEYDED
ncbi:MAG TPA: ATP-binding cassette domain-containing protein [Acidimicrobiales bacterium]|nr:ATP-binding cassette domain-containing protein [Acidimicrobiales bacterium]